MLGLQTEPFRATGSVRDELLLPGERAPDAEVGLDPRGRQLLGRLLLVATVGHEAEGVGAARAARRPTR